MDAFPSYDGAPISFDPATNVISAQGRSPISGGLGGVVIQVSTDLFGTMTMDAVSSDTTNVWWSFDGTTHTFQPIDGSGTPHPEYQLSATAASGASSGALMLASDALAVSQYFMTCAWPSLYYDLVISTANTAFTASTSSYDAINFIEIGVGWGFMMQAALTAFGALRHFQYFGVDPYSATSFADHFSTVEVGALLGVDPTTGLARSVDAAFDALFGVVSGFATLSGQAAVFRESTANWALGEGEPLNSISTATSASNVRNVVFIDGAHDFSTVTRDLEAAWSYCASAGDMILLDDSAAAAYPGVLSAIQAFSGTGCSQTSLTLTPGGYPIYQILRTS